MNSSDLYYMPAVEAARAIRRKELSAVELARAVLARIERLNPTLNAFCTVTAESALAQAREAEQAVTRGGPLGALHGIPVSIKDLAFTRGVADHSRRHGRGARADVREAAAHDSSRRCRHRGPRPAARASWSPCPRPIPRSPAHEGEDSSEPGNRTPISRAPRRWHPPPLRGLA